MSIFREKIVTRLNSAERRIDEQIRKTMDERQHKLQATNSQRGKNSEASNRMTSMMINQLYRRNTTFEEKQLANPIGFIKTSESTYNKQKQAMQSPGDVLIKLLQAIDAQKKDQLVEAEAENRLPKRGVINKIKAYQYGTGEVKEFSRDSFYVALEAFEAIYNTIIRDDLEQKSRARDLDFKSLLKLIRMYLEKIVTRFSSWGAKEQKAVDDIITRTEKGYFANKLKKKFLSDKNQYTKINVFERLNDIEVVSLSRLFKQIKHMLLNRKESYISNEIGQPKKKDFKIRNLIVKADVEGALKREEDLRNPHYRIEERSLPNPQIQPIIDSPHKAPPGAIRLKVERQEQSVPVEGVDIVQARIIKKENLKVFNREIEDLEEYIGLIIHNFILKYLYSLPQTSIDSQMQISFSKDKSQKNKNKHKKAESMNTVKNYKIALIKKDSGLAEGSNTQSRIFDTHDDPPIIKRKDLVFELIERKPHLGLHTKYKRLPWNPNPKDSLPSITTNGRPTGQQTTRLRQIAHDSKPEDHIEGPSLHRSMSRIKPASSRHATLAVNGNNTNSRPHDHSKPSNFVIDRLVQSISSDAKFMAELERDLRSRLSSECMQAIAEHDIACFVEMRKRIEETVGRMIAVTRPRFRVMSRPDSLSMLSQLNNIKRAMADGKMTQKMIFKSRDKRSTSPGH